MDSVSFFLPMLVSNEHADSVTPTVGETPDPLTVFIKDFKQHANLDTLIPELSQRKILIPEELEDLDPWRLKRGDRITLLLSIISHKGWEGVNGMIDSLEAEMDHPGHKDLARILNKKYCKFPILCECIVDICVHVCARN